MNLRPAQESNLRKHHAGLVSPETDVILIKESVRMVHVRYLILGIPDVGQHLRIVGRHCPKLIVKLFLYAHTEILNCYFLFNTMSQSSNGKISLMSDVLTNS